MGKREETERAKQIATAFERINELKGAINSQFLLIDVIMEKDGQADDVRKQVDEMRITMKKAVHAELVQQWMRWTDIADARKEDK